MLLSIETGATARRKRQTLFTDQIELAKLFALRAEEDKAERFLGLAYRQVLEFQEQIQVNQAALRAATLNPARFLGRDKDLGTIEKGKYADIIAVSGDPLQDITEMQRVKFVMKGGAVVRNDFAAK